MKNRIALKAEPRRTVIVLAIFTLISLFLVLFLLISVNKDCMQLNSLLRSSYDYSVTTQEPILENDYYQFNAGIDFALSPDSQTSLNAEVIMQTDSSAYTDLIFWNAHELSTHGVAVSKNITRANGLHLGDKLYSKHIVNGEVFEYAIEEIIPETVCVRKDKSKGDSSGIIIMGYDADYVDHITHNTVAFTDESITAFMAKCSDTAQNIIYRDDEVYSTVLSIIPYLAVFSLISIVVTIFLVCILTKGIACNFRRLVMLGFEKQKLNRAYCSYISMSGVTPIVIALALSSMVFLFTDITAIRMILVMWIPLIELLTLFIATSVSNRQLWRK